MILNYRETWDSTLEAHLAIFVLFSISPLLHMVPVFSLVHIAYKRWVKDLFGFAALVLPKLSN